MKNQNKNNFLGSGWSFPVRFMAETAELEITQYEKNIRENIDIILKTRRGDHVMNQNFGSGLEQYVFHKIDDTLQGEIIDSIKWSLLNYEPRITVKSVTVESVDLKRGIVSVSIQYLYNQTNTRHNYVYPFHLIEGTNLNLS